MIFEPCPSCRRHVAATAAECPFCRARTRPTPRTISYAGRLTRAAIFAGAAACSGTAAKPPPPPPPVEYPPETPRPPAEGTANVSGVVRLDGHRKSGIPVELQHEDGETKLQAFTNAKGEYVFLDVAPGKYVLMPEPGYENPRPQDGPVLQMAVPVELAPNANERRDLSLVGPMPYVRDTGPCCKPYGAPPARRRVV